MNPTLSRISFGLALAVAATACAIVATDPGYFQHDLRTYVAAGEAAWLGLDPWSLTDLSQAAGHRIKFPFVYTPALLLPCMALALLPWAVAYHLVWVSKVALWIALARLWHRGFGIPTRPITALLGLLAFDAVLLVDLRTGNINLFEQTLLLWGLVAWLRGRSTQFAVAVGAAAVVKLQPVLLLGLLLWERRPGWHRSMAAGVATFALPFVGALVLTPDLFWRFLHAGTQIQESGGVVLPTLWLWLQELAPSGPWELEIESTAYVILVCAVAGSLRYVASRVGLRHPLFVAALALALVVALPRVKDYTFVLVIGPALYVLSRLPDVPRRVGSLLLVLPAGHGLLGGLLDAPSVLPELPRYWTAFQAVALLAAATVLARRSGGDAVSEPTPG